MITARYSFFPGTQVVSSHASEHVHSLQAKLLLSLMVDHARIKAIDMKISELQKEKEQLLQILQKTCLHDWKREAGVGMICIKCRLLGIRRVHFQIPPK